MFKSLFIVFALAAAPLALANTAPVSIETGDFAAQRAQVEKQLADGKTYVAITPADRAKVTEALSRMAATLETAPSVDALDADKKAALYNDQQTVNTVLTVAAEDSRVVCAREVVTGSHRKATVCATVAERRVRRQQDQDALRKEQRAPATQRQ